MIISLPNSFLCHFFIPSIFPSALVVKALKSWRDSKAQALKIDPGIIFNNALIRLPLTPSIHYRLGMTYFANGDSAQALEELRTALRISEHFPEVEQTKNMIRQLVGPAGVESTFPKRFDDDEADSTVDPVNPS